MFVLCGCKRGICAQKGEEVRTVVGGEEQRVLVCHCEGSDISVLMLEAHPHHA